MSQHDYEITNADANTGTAMRAAINAALQALASCSAGASEPATMYAYQLWADTANSLLKMRNAANNAWITLGTLGSALLGLIDDTAYDATSWNGVTDKAPSKNAVRDKIESLSIPSKASSAEVNTGTDDAKFITPDALAGSNLGIRYVQLIVNDSTALTTGDGKVYFRIPAGLNGMNLVSVAAHCGTASSSGTPTIQVRNVTDSVDMLSTALTIDANETDSSTATAAVIDTTHDDVATGDFIAIDIDEAGTGTAWLVVELGFQLP